MDLELTRRDGDHEVVLVCTGRIDAETGDDLARAVAEELRRGQHAVRLDLTGIGFLSSAGIRGLFETQRAAKAAGGSCLIRLASPVVRKVLDLTRLTPLLMEPERGATPDQGGAPSASRGGSVASAPPDDVVCGPVRLARLVRPASAPLPGRVVGDPRAALTGAPSPIAPRRLPRHAFGLGLGSFADESPAVTRAGELAALCGTVFQRPPHPHAAIDFIEPTGALLAEVALLSGLVWEGVPSGQAGFEPAGDDPTVRLDELVEAVLAQCEAPAVAMVVAGEIFGLVGAELIRPLSDAGGEDGPLAGRREITSSWLSFSREPVHAHQSAVVVGVAARNDGATLQGFVRQVPGRSFSTHFHAVVFPFRPLRREGADLAGTISDLAASRPLAVMHLIADPHPVLGSGRSEFVRGAVWFAPLAVAAAGSPS